MVQKITKRFPGVVALSGVDLQVYPAEILALIGENGAGKSTLMKILACVQPADEGELLVEGKVVRFSGVQDAQKSGIALIHQELNLAENLTVAGNMFLGREPGKFGWIDQAVIQRESKRVLEMVGLEVSPETLLSELTLGKQQLVDPTKFPGLASQKHVACHRQIFRQI